MGETTCKTCIFWEPTIADVGVCRWLESLAPKWLLAGVGPRSQTTKGVDGDDCPAWQGHE